MAFLLLSVVNLSISWNMLNLEMSGFWKSQSLCKALDFLMNTARDRCFQSC